MKFLYCCLALALVIWLASKLVWTVRRDWDKTVNSERDGLPLLYIKNLIHWRGRRIDLHKIVYPDPWECFHSHPARAIRIILWGGYTEELQDGTIVSWWPGKIGLVQHDTVHRINRLRYASPSYSLWIRGKVRHPTGLFGTGWPLELQSTYHTSSEK
jgi:hypothetical protein